jgi:metal-responsive CopG/Arc/MetJ family transcriptional regulator
MKAAISLEDDLLRQADGAARSMGVSRSRLFAVAVAEFLQRQRQDRMLAQLNEVYSDGMSPAEKLQLKAMKTVTRRAVKGRG